MFFHSTWQLGRAMLTAVPFGARGMAARMTLLKKSPKGWPFKAPDGWTYARVMKRSTKLAGEYVTKQAKRRAEGKELGARARAVLSEMRKTPVFERVQ